jgi:hypothetical protein
VKRILIAATDAKEVESMMAEIGQNDALSTTDSAKFLKLDADKIEKAKKMKLPGKWMSSRDILRNVVEQMGR